MPGEHNVLNATAAIATALELDIQRDVIREGLAQFRGVDRRFQVKGVERGVTVVDDYGHHPTEIRATLAAARACAPRRLHVLFQPHRYTRTMHLMDEFARSFHQADRVFVLDIYAASEQPIEGVTAEVLVDRMRQYGHRGAEYVGSIANGVQRIAGRPGAGRHGHHAGRGQCLVGVGNDSRRPEDERERRSILDAESCSAQSIQLARWRWPSWPALLLFVSTAMATRRVQSMLLGERALLPGSEFVATGDRGRCAGDSRGRQSLRVARSDRAGLRAGSQQAASFSIPLAERRRRLLAIDWIEDASVLRIWPNQLIVKVRERRPVAFAKLPIGVSGQFRYLLIDAQGVLLSVPRQRFDFPVLTGVTEEQTEDERRARVVSMQQLLRRTGTGRRRA